MGLALGLTWHCISIPALLSGRLIGKSHPERYTYMKIKFIVIGTVACAMLAVAVGCKKEEPAAPAEQPKATEAVPPESAKAMDAVKATTNEAASQATAQLNAAQGEAQGVIDRAKQLIAENKYQDALSSLGQLANVKLTPEQQKLVDDLKAQIQKALAKTTAGDAASALGGALGGKK